jgi:hypothetical protein
MATEQLLREKRDSVVLEHIKAENRHDVDGSVATIPYTSLSGNADGNRT